MQHPKLRRCLNNIRQSPSQSIAKSETHVIDPPVLKLTVGSISFPAPSIAFVILKAASVLEMFKNSDSSARCAPELMVSFEQKMNLVLGVLPGHTRRPKPNTNFRGFGSGVGPRWRLGSKTDGSGYISLSCVIALGVVSSEPREIQGKRRGY